MASRSAGGALGGSDELRRRCDRLGERAGIAGGDRRLGVLQRAVAPFGDVLAGQRARAVRRAQRVEHVGASVVHVGPEVPALVRIVEERPDVVDGHVVVAVEERCRWPARSGAGGGAGRCCARRPSTSGWVICCSGIQRLTSISPASWLCPSGESWRNSDGARPSISWVSGVPNTSWSAWTEVAPPWSFMPVDRGPTTDMPFGPDLRMMKPSSAMCSTSSGRGRRSSGGRRPRSDERMADASVVGDAAGVARPAGTPAGGRRRRTGPPCRSRARAGRAGRCRPGTRRSPDTRGTRRSRPRREPTAADRRGAARGDRRREWPASRA